MRGVNVEATAHHEPRYSYLIVDLETRKYIELEDVGSKHVWKNTHTNETHGHHFVVVEDDGKTISYYQSSFVNKPMKPNKVEDLNENGKNLVVDRKNRVYDADAMSMN